MLIINENKDVFDKFYFYPDKNSPKIGIENTSKKGMLLKHNERINNVEINIKFKKNEEIISDHICFILHMLRIFM